jgi:hypothetical protein
MHNTYSFKYGGPLNHIFIFIMENWNVQHIFCWHCHYEKLTILSTQHNAIWNKYYSHFHSNFSVKIFFPTSSFKYIHYFK